MALKEYSEEIVPEHTIVVSREIKRPSIRYSFDNEPLKQGDLLEVVIKVNGVETDTLKYVVSEAIEAEKELRPLIKVDCVIMNAFPKAEIKQIEE